MNQRKMKSFEEVVDVLNKLYKYTEERENELLFKVIITCFKSLFSIMLILHNDAIANIPMEKVE